MDRIGKVGLVAAVAFLGGCFFLLFHLHGNRPAPPDQQAELEPAPVREPIPRRQFSILVYDKNQEGVIFSVGKPDDTSEYGSVKLWKYNRRTYDPVTGKVDAQAVLTFGDGTNVTSVSY